jgi:hypothetical protein
LRQAGDYAGKFPTETINLQRRFTKTMKQKKGAMKTKWSQQVVLPMGLGKKRARCFSFLSWRNFSNRLSELRFEFHPRVRRCFLDQHAQGLFLHWPF